MIANEKSLLGSAFRWVLDSFLGAYCFLAGFYIHQCLFGEKMGFYPLIVGILFISGYPIWGWKRKSPWRLVGDWSFPKWILAGISVGLFTALLQIVL